MALLNHQQTPTLLDIFEISFSNEDFDLIFDEMDADHNGDLDYKEFVQFLKLEEIFRTISSKKNRDEFQHNKFIIRLFEYIMDHKMKTNEFINSIDSNHDGKLDNLELYSFFQKLFSKKHIEFDQEEFEKFLHLLNKNHDEYIEVKEIRFLL